MPSKCRLGVVLLLLNNGIGRKNACHGYFISVNRVGFGLVWFGCVVVKLLRGANSVREFRDDVVLW